MKGQFERDFMDLITAAVLGIVILLIIVLLALVNRLSQKISGTEPKQTDPTLITVLHGDMNKLQTDVRGLQDRVDKTMVDMRECIVKSNTDSQKQLSAGMLASSKVLQELKGDLTRVQEAQKQIKGLDDSVKKLQDIFASPKLRGGFGEFTLESLLNDTLPGQYKMQHYYGDGTAVDAAVFIQDKIVPIDSKFPLDRYRDYISADDASREVMRNVLVKTIIDLMKDISAKYIKPAEKTMDFALLYLPSNKMYYDIFLSDEGKAGSATEKALAAANQHKVFPICPANLYVYLKAVGLGLKGLHIEENAQEIIKRLENVQKKFQNFLSEYEKLESKIGDVVKHFNESKDRFRKLDDEINRVLRLKDDGVGPD